MRLLKFCEQEAMPSTPPLLVRLCKASSTLPRLAGRLGKDAGFCPDHSQHQCIDFYEMRLGWLKTRHGRACPGHPRPSGAESGERTWMPIGKRSDAVLRTATDKPGHDRVKRAGART